MKKLSMAGAAMMLLPAANAQIVADPSAPGSQQPTIINTANGLPQVNIQAPSAAGVSRNTYSQFDVQQQGAILNNSRTDTQTQLGGWIQRNPNLVNGGARVILNEVNSSNPSYLHGYVEVAGDRAQVVIANPSGVTCDGCGFINANRATLTTGAPIMNGGSLDGYLVRGGAVTVLGAGLDARDADYTDIIARAVQVNAGIWSKELKVTAGANQVDAGNTQAISIAANDPAPVFGIDVAQLGGMYANKIILIGTEAGVGVRNAGQIGAVAGDVAVTADGKLINSGSLQASGALALETGDALINRGLIDAQDTFIDALALNNLGTGRIYGDHLAINATTLSNRAETQAETTDGVPAAPIIAARNRLDIAAETIDNREHAMLFSAGDMVIGGSLDANHQAIGQAGTLDNNSATIEATGALDLSARHINNINDHFSTEEVEVSRQDISEYQLDGRPNRYRPDEVTVKHYEVDQLMTPDGFGYVFNRYDYTRVVTETRIKETDPAKISSGGAMHIAADTVMNDKSRIVAGGVLSGDIGALTNTDVAGRRVTTDNGTVFHYYDIERSGLDEQGLSTADYRPAALIQTTSLTPTVYRQNASGTSDIDAPITLPDNSLFALNTTPGFNYLVQSDPRFTDYRNWLSSDYLLQQMNADPALTQKRLGDGFYEQQLIREQVAELTGRRFLDGYASDEAQYRALLDNGATYAMKLNLRVGVALSAAQMAQLTSDVVLLIEKDVTLPNGEVTKVLAPQLYARVKEGDIGGAGALFSGDAVDLKVTGDIVNSGTMAGRTLISLNADNIGNLGGRISASDAKLLATNDIDHFGGTIDAADSLTLSAGRDLNVVSTTATSQSAQGSRIGIDRIAALYVANPDATLTASAGRDVNLNAAQIVNSGKGGSTVIAAGNNLNLGTVAESSRQSIAWDADNYRKETAGQDAGSTIAAAGNVQLLAGNDINARAADVSSEQGAIAASAGNDINLDAGEARQTVDEGHRSEGSGMLSSKTVTTRNGVNQTQARGSTFSGDTVSLLSGNDIHVKGSNVVSTAGTTIVANRDVTIEAAVNTSEETHLRNEETSGMFSGGGLGVTIGTQEKSNAERQSSADSSASRIGSTGGNVSVIAGNHYLQTGSQLLAPQGDINIVGKKVDIVAATDIESNTQDTEFKQTGLSISITNPVIAAVQAVQQMKTASEKTKDSRMKGLAGAAAALTAANTANAVVNTDPSQPAGGIDLALSIGASKNESHREQNNTTVQGSSLAAGGDINIAAVGAGKDSDLTIQGSDIAAGGNINLKADDEINLLAVQNSSEQHSSNKGISASIGISIGTSGLLFNAGLSGSRGRGDGSDITYTNSHVDAGKQLTMTSGGDTNIIGGVASGKQVSVEVGTTGSGNLNIASLQDSSDYKSKQQSLGGSVSYGIGKISGSVNASQSKVNGEYVSVNEQSGITAGDGGFDIKVHGNTDLAGGKIASTGKAVQGGKNSLTTETLTQSDIANHSQYEASSMSISIGGGYSSAGSAMNGTGIGFGNASGSETGTTQNGISAGNIVITDGAAQQAKTGKTVEQTIASINTDVSTEKDTSGKLTKGWDGLQLQEDVEAQAQIMAAFGKESSKGIGTYATSRENDLRRQARAAHLAGDRVKAAQLDSEAEKWSEGGDYRTALHAAAGALAGGIGGAAGATASALAMPEIAKVIDEMDLPKAVKQGLEQVTAGAIGAVVGGAASVAAGVNVEANNSQLHQREKTLAERLAEQSEGKYTQAQIEDQMRGMVMKQNGVSEAVTVDMVIGGEASDTGGTWLLAGETVDGQPISTQQLAPVDEALRAYIVRNTTGSSVPSLITYEGPYDAPDAPVYSNTAGMLPTAKCAVTAADCAAGIAPPLTPKEWQKRNSQLADFFSETSMNFTRVAAISTTTGQPEFAVPFEAAAGVMDLLEQAVRPNIGQVGIDSIFLDQTAKEVSDRLHIPLPVVIEATEKYVKPQLQSWRDAINEQFKW